MRKSTVLFVIAIAAFVMAVGSNAQAGDEHTYIGAAKCKMCHKTQYASWEKTTHAKALEDAKASTDREFGDDCLKCHATNANAEMGGVQCEACHGPGSDYKKMSIMKDREASIANGLIIPTQATCDGCHVGDDHAPKVDFEKEKANVKAIHEHKAK